MAALETTLSLRPVGILGGMGPAAGADFVRQFVQACAALMVERGIPVRDQNFPEHWLAQVPVPDRTAGLAQEGASAAQPLEPMLQAMGRLAALGTRAVAIACNTAHAWHPAMQSRFPQLDVLDVAEEVASHLKSSGLRSTGLLATEGTYRAGVYDAAMRRAGIECHVPEAQEQALLMRGIYEGVKSGRMDVATRCFEEAASSFARRHDLPSLILGCTEIPLALRSVPGRAALRLVDPGLILAKALARSAYDGPRVH